jgi:isopenicillin-N N-acyltransferase-like protein
MLRDILQFDHTIDDAISRMADQTRTCDLILGVGDGNLAYVRGIQYSYSVVNVMDDLNMRPANSTWHFRVPETVYFGMDWLCPGAVLCLARNVGLTGARRHELGARHATEGQLGHTDS